GDGTFADGSVVQHTYTAGQWVATVSADGATATVVVRAEGVTLAAPPRARFGAAAVFSGAVVPAVPGEAVSLSGPSGPIASTAAGADGSFRFRVAHLAGPGPYVARAELGTSTPVRIAIRPRVTAVFAGTPLSGNR